MLRRHDEDTTRTSAGSDVVGRIPARSPRRRQRSTTARHLLRRLAIGIVTSVAVVVGSSSAVGAHDLDSSSIVVTIEGDEVSATITVAIEALAGALDDADVAAHLDDAIGYIGDHLSVEAADGEAWTETYETPAVETIEGIESLVVDVSFGSGGWESSSFTVTYDAVIEAIPDHEAVVVLIDSRDEISTPGILTSSDTRLVVTDSRHGVPIGDMVRYGFEHVLDGADHLLFLLMLLVPAPLVERAGRWRAGRSVGDTLRRVVHVVTAFTVGHSITLVASVLGWVSAPGRPVEILIATSVGVSAVHAMRPLASRGEEVIAAGFGLVHGLAFAGVLADLGLGGTTSVLALLAFNVGVEVAQLVTILCVFPAFWLFARTRWYPKVRVGVAAFGLAAAVGWALDRIGVVGNPLAGLEEAGIEHRLVVAAALTSIALVAVLASRWMSATGVDVPGSDADPGDRREVLESGVDAAARSAARAPVQFVGEFGPAPKTNALRSPSTSRSTRIP